MKDKLRSTLKKNSKFIEEIVCPSPKLEGGRIHLLQFHVSDTCNLKCKHCSHFSPLCKQRDYKKGDIIKDLERMAFLTKENPVDDIGILGGEPLLNPDIEFYMEKTREIFPYPSITVITNAILLEKMPDSFFITAAKNRIVIVLSKYFEDDFYTNIIKKLESFNVIWRFTPERLGGMNFVSCNLCKNSKYTEEEAWDLCPTKNSCILLRDGKLYSCPSIPFRKNVIEYFNEDIPTFEDDGVSIYENNFNEIITELSKPKKSCKYCSDDTFKAIYFHELTDFKKSDYFEED